MADNQHTSQTSDSALAGDSAPFDLTKIERASSSNVASLRKAEKEWEQAQRDPKFPTYNAEFQKLRNDIEAHPDPKERDKLAHDFHQFCKDNGCESIMKAQQSMLEQTQLKFDIEETQKLLNKLGYNTGEPDGIMGKRTIAAIQAYERDHNIPKETGSYKGTGSDGIPRFYVAEETTQSLVVEAEHLNKHGVKRKAADLENITLTPRGGETAQDTIEEMAGNLGIPAGKREQFIEDMKNLVGKNPPKMEVQIDLDSYNISSGQMRAADKARDDFSIT